MLSLQPMPSIGITSSGLPKCNNDQRKIAYPHTGNKTTTPLSLLLMSICLGLLVFRDKFLSVEIVSIMWKD